MISIIVPTKNEESYLPLLLDSIYSQEIGDFEIIIADAGSTDKTLDIAKSYGCRIVEGGLPAKGRNNGARESRGDLLIFVDADAIFTLGFLNGALKEFYRRNLGVAGTLQNPFRIEGKFSLAHKIIYETINQYMVLTERIKPHMQVCMFVHKEVHDRVNGFDERIIYGEDSNYAERAGKISRFGILKSGRILVSPRRFVNNKLFSLKLAYLNVLRAMGKEFYFGETNLRYFK